MPISLFSVASQLTHDRLAPQRTTIGEQTLDLPVKVLHGMAERLDLAGCLEERGDRWPALQPWQFADEDPEPMHISTMAQALVTACSTTGLRVG